MAGKHSANTKKSKAPVIIIIVVSALVVAAAVFAVIFFMKGGFGGKNTDATSASTSEVNTVAAVADTTAAQQTTAQADAQSSDDHDHSSDTDSKVDVAVPTEEQGNVSYFNATFIPNGTVVDTFTGGNTSLREVFGNGYNTGGVITFNSDGTFSDSIASEHADKGAYVVQNEKISATYENDKNMEITVTEWDGDTPVSFYINYAGYNVYFG